MLEPIVRPATPDDVDAIVRLCKLRGPREMDARGATAVDRLNFRVQGYYKRRDLIGTDPNLHILLATHPQDGRAVGYVVVVTGLRESITGEPQTILFDHATEPDVAADVLPLLIRQAEDHSRSKGADFMVLQIPPGDEDEKLFESMGYFVDANRITHEVSEDVPPGIEEARKRYEVRLATGQDHMFVLYLNTICAPYTIPPGHRTAPEIVGERYLDAYLNLKMEGDPNMQIFILQDRGGYQPHGFLILKFGYRDEASIRSIAYIYDIAVHPDHWGRLASQLLMYEGEQFSREKGVQSILADISATNPRALATSTKYLGYSIEWRRWSRWLPKEESTTQGPQA